MDLFKPSKKILDKLSGLERRIKMGDSFYVESTLKFPPKFSESILNEKMGVIVNLFSSVYSTDFHRRSGIYNCIADLLYNAVHYGGSRDDKETVLKLYLSHYAMCAAVNDGGDYFKRKDIKRIFENKLPITEFDGGTDSPRSGVPKIYLISDLIYVDNKVGTIFCLKETPDK